MNKLMMEVDLETTENGHTRLVMHTWIERLSTIPEGTVLKLKDDKRVWTVRRIYPIYLPYHELESNRNWDNNNYDKHDGTSMKKRLK